MPRAELGADGRSGLHLGFRVTGIRDVLGRRRVRARPVVARMSPATAAEAGLTDGDKVTVAADHGSVTVPVELVPMADHVVWLPAAGLPGGTTLRAELGAGHGAMVTLRRPE